MCSVFNALASLQPAPGEQLVLENSAVNERRKVGEGDRWGWL